MQYVNDDMDDLFRRAAENYPLDTNSADWSKVLAAMQGQDASKPVAEKKSSKNSRLLWLLVLLPLSFICNRVYNHGSNLNSTAPQTVAQKQTGANDTHQTTSIKEEQLNTEPGTTTTGVTTAGSAEKNYSTAKQSFSEPANQGLTQKNASTQMFFKGNERKPVEGFAALSDENQIVFSQEENSITTDNSISPNYTREIGFEKAKPESPEFVLNKELLPLKNPSDENGNKKPETGKRQKKFYVGVIGGIDATTVKFQKIENKGHDFGVLVGYAINKKWSIETGSYVENKYYYSEGKYFKAPSNYRVKDVSGDCKMIEVPLSVRYNFSSRKNSSWFATLGSSSFFMTSEGYTYDYYNPSWPSAYIERKNTSFNLFTNISVTGGYTHQLGRLTDLRIEPYLKIPVSGMGIGKLPLLSTGLHVGVIKRF